jgi:hypothetical protein
MTINVKNRFGNYSLIKSSSLFPRVVPLPTIKSVACPDYVGNKGIPIKELDYIPIIKRSQDLENCKLASSYAKQVLEWIEPFVVPGVSTLELNKKGMKCK